MDELTSEARVKAVYPDADLVGYHDGACAIFSRSAAASNDTGYLGWGQTTFNRSSTQANREAWADAASRLPPAPIAAGDGRDQLIDALEAVDATLCACRYDNNPGCNCDIHAARRIIAEAILKAEATK